MQTLFTNVNVFENGVFRRKDITISDRFLNYGKTVSDSDQITIPGDGFTIFPGFADVHVHFREPGFSYKETIRSGSMAAAHGGYTAVCTMPNLDPTPDNYEKLKVQLDIIEKDAVIPVYPYGTITVGEKGEQLSDLAGMAPYTAAFSDDGHGVQRDEMMREAMLQAKALGKLIVAQCEVNSLLRGGYTWCGRPDAATMYATFPQRRAWRSSAKPKRKVWM